MLLWRLRCVTTTSSVYFLYFDLWLTHLDRCGADQLDAGAEDVEMHDGLAQVVCDPSGLASVRKCFTEAGLEPTLCELVYNPKEFLNLETEQRETFDKLVDALNEDDDVNQIHHNINE